MQLYVLGLVDHTHTAAAEFLDDAVVRNGLADHWTRILRPRSGQVNESSGVGRVSKRLLLKNRDYACAVKRRWSTAGESPARELGSLHPEAIGAAVEETKPSEPPV